ncbi:hypothetical protein [Desulforamulus reducens]|uniref:hypothetical protein n=1 Tax=Desulforamulus reducens TaxID=59610 RepID=UPI0002D9E95A|nr:hypothetical protein [Desulforamulus reducens]
MSFESVINAMNQQSNVLKELEELLAHNDKQNNLGHTVKLEDIERLKSYVANMKLAVKTATALATHYKNAGKTTNAETKQAPPAEPADYLSRKPESNKELLGNESH